MLFKLLSNSYKDEKGKEYKKGALIESASRLDKKFKNGFELYRKEPEEEAQTTPNIPSPEVIADMGEDIITSNSSPNISSAVQQEDVTINIAEADEEVVNKTKTASKKGKSKFKDITNNFPLAQSISMKVLTDTKTYRIVDATDESIVKKGILTAKKVSSLLKKYSV